MAIDSAEKRQSALIDACGMLIPDGTIATLDRAWLLGEYIGVSTTPISSTPGSNGDLDIRLYDQNGKRMLGSLSEWISELRFEVLERGGFGQGSFKALATWEEMTISGGERLDVWLWGVIVYRGRIRMPQQLVGAEQSSEPTLYGPMEQTNAYQTDCRYAYGVPVDLSRLVQDIVADHAQRPGRMPGLVTDIQVIGVTVQQFDATGKDLTQSLNAICDLAPNQCIWGFDVNTAGQDRLYFRPRSAGITHRYSVGGQAVEFDYQKDLPSVVNRVYLRGGKVRQPNLAPDGSFESPVPNNDSAGNLLTDYSFELNTTWSYNSGASRKGTGDFGGPRTGSNWAELDTPGENIQQTVNIDYRVPLAAWCWARRETAGTLRQVRLRVEGLDVSNAVVQTFETDYIDPAQGVSTDLYFQIPNIETGSALVCDFSAQPSIVKARVTVETNGGTASNDGVDVDDVALVEKDGAAPDSWTYALHGAAKRDRLVWQERDFSGFGTSHGCYGVLVQASGVAVGDDWLELRTVDTARISVKTTSNYCLAVRHRTDGSLGHFQLIVYQYQSDGTLVYTSVEDVYSDFPYWTAARFEFGIDSFASTIGIALRVMDNVEHGFDAVFLCEGDAPTEIIAEGDAGGYWEGDTYEHVADVTNTTIPDLTSDAAGSIDTYGIQEQRVENTAVTNWSPLGQTFLRDYFNAHAVPPIRAKLRLFGPEEPLTIDGTVRMLNLPNPPPALFPSRVDYTINATGGVEIDAQLGNERPDQADLLSLTEQRAKHGL